MDTVGNQLVVGTAQRKILIWDLRNLGEKLTVSSTSYFRYLRAKARFKLEISNSSDQMFPERNRLCYGINWRSSCSRVLWRRRRSPAKTVKTSKSSLSTIFYQLCFQMPSPEKWRHRGDLPSQCSCFPPKSKTQPLLATHSHSSTKHSLLEVPMDSSQLGTDSTKSDSQFTGAIRRAFPLLLLVQLAIR